MKTLLTAWLIALTVYLLTPVVFADERAYGDDLAFAQPRLLWQRSHVGGEVCLMVQRLEDSTPAMVKVWLVSGDELKWLRTVEGADCLDVDFGRRNQLWIHGQANVDVSIIEDRTSPFFTIELPL